MICSISTFMIALALAMDAFAASVTSGLTMKRLHIRCAVLMAASFGFFQGFMPLAGWLAGSCARDIVEPFDHWIAFFLLSGIGGKMIYESLWMNNENSDRKEPKNPFSMSMILLLSIATSIDALAVGVTISFLGDPIIVPALVFCGVTFVMSFFGVYIGYRMGHLFENKLEIIGGLILIGIGIRILTMHLLA